MAAAGVSDAAEEAGAEADEEVMTDRKEAGGCDEGGLACAGVPYALVTLLITVIPTHTHTHTLTLTLSPETGQHGTVEGGAAAARAAPALPARSV